MIASTQGVVLQQLKYGETSIIVKIYTQAYGLQSYIVKGIRSVKTKQKSALFLPLTLLDMQVYHSKKQQLQYIKEVKIAYPYQEVYSHIQKSTIAVFLAEVLQKCLNEEEADELLFRFIFQSLITFDKEGENYADFHLLFLVDLCTYLGFAPQAISTQYAIGDFYFDMREACFVPNKPSHSDCLDSERALLFRMLLTYRAQIKRPVFCSAHRSDLLICLMRYYALHLSDMGEIRSLAVLREVFST